MLKQSLFFSQQTQLTHHKPIRPTNPNPTPHNHHCKTKSLWSQTNTITQYPCYLQPKHRDQWQGDLQNQRERKREGGGGVRSWRVNKDRIDWGSISCFGCMLPPSHKLVEPISCGSHQLWGGRRIHLKQGVFSWIDSTETRKKKIQGYFWNDINIRVF